MTPKTASHHHIGDDEFGSPDTPQWTGRVPALSGADVTHRGKSAASIVTTSSKYVNKFTETNRPSKCVSEIVVESTRATVVDNLEDTDKSFIVEPQADGKQRVRKVGMNLTATSLFAFSQFCRVWNRSNVVQLSLDALHVSRVDVLEIGVSSKQRLGQ